jgi:putative membrane protein
MLEPTLNKNDSKAKWVIWIFSVIVFAVVVALGRFKLNVDLGFDVHIFAAVNAWLNSTIFLLLLAALWAVKKQQFKLHKQIMLAALVLSVLFLVSYIAHHLLAGDTKYGGQGLIRYVYYFILITHIFLAAIILPFILFTAYRGLTGEYKMHKKLARYTWPLWLYVAATGPIVYWMIKPYY